MENKLKLGFIGLGNRGSFLIQLIAANFRDVDIVAVCDVYKDRTDDAAEEVKKERGVLPKKYERAEDLLEDEAINTIIISASWEAHIPLAVAAMRAGKITGLEVGGAYALTDCWELVRTYEQTRSPFMFLENCCFGRNELLATGLVRNGVLGEVVYCHGAYGHDLREEICGGIQNRHYRLRNYLARDCDNYPTHELGPIAKILNVNRGNRMVKLVSLSSKSRGLSSFVNGKEGYVFLQDKNFAQGDVVCSLITCSDGSLISLKLDTCLPRAYSREFTVSGTKGIFSEDNNLVLSERKHFDHNLPMYDFRDSAADYEMYLPEIWKEELNDSLKAGHGGMDALMLRAFFDAAESGAEMPIDVYDAASWMAVTCQSEVSIANGGMPVEIPDFTGGKWVMREAKDVTKI